MKLSQNKLSYISFAERRSDIWNGVVSGTQDFGIGFFDSFKNLAKGIFSTFEFLAGGVVVVVSNVIGTPKPDWAENSVNQTLGTFLIALKDPLLIAESMAQGVSDTYEEEGIVYMTGYVTGELTQVYLAKKAAEKLQGKGTGSPDFRNMSQDEFFQYLDDNKISLNDLSKVTDWERVPDLIDYAKYKDVYDNSKYFDQTTGNIKWPGEYGDINTDGFLNGIFENTNLTPGQVIDRYGSNYGTFFADIEASIPDRAMAPGSDFGAYNQYEILKEIPVREGVIAPWFDQPGGGIQYMIDPDFVETIKNLNIDRKLPLIDILIEMGYIKRL